MITAMPNVFIINIHPRNWEACVKQHIFGLRKGSRHPRFEGGDVFLVRRKGTGRDYGVMGIWSFSHEELVTDQSQVPWIDGRYEWKLYFKPLIDFRTPVCEEFSGSSKYSRKMDMYSARMTGAVKLLSTREAATYVDTILKEKPVETSLEVEYGGHKTRLRDALRGVVPRLSRGRPRIGIK